MPRSRTLSLDHRATSLAGAIAWLVVPTAFQLSYEFEKTRPWEGLPLVAYGVAAAGLMLGAVALLAGAFRDSVGRRSAMTWIGIGVLGIGVAVSTIGSWAIPVWAVLFGAGMGLVAFGARLGGVGWLISAGFLVSPLVALVLTELEVGRQDSYGDYPVAWLAAAWTAGLTAAAGMIIWSRSPAKVDTPDSVEVLA